MKKLVFALATIIASVSFYSCQDSELQEIEDSVLEMEAPTDDEDPVVPCPGGAGNCG